MGNFVKTLGMSWDDQDDEMGKFFPNAFDCCEDPIFFLSMGRADDKDAVLRLYSEGIF